MLKLLEDTFVSQKKGICSFFLIRPVRRKLPLSSSKHFLKIYFFPRIERGLWTEKMTKIKLARVLVTNSIIFATFTFLIFVLLCHNLDSSTLKCEGSLTYLITFSLKCIECRSNCMKDKTLPYPVFNYFTHHMSN